MNSLYNPIMHGAHAAPLWHQRMLATARGWQDRLEQAHAERDNHTAVGFADGAGGSTGVVADDAGGAGRRGIAFVREYERRMGIKLIIVVFIDLVKFVVVFVCVN